MTDEALLAQRMARIEAVLLNIEVILVGIAALLAGCAMFALAYIDGLASDSGSLPFWAGLVSFVVVGLALRSRPPRRRTVAPGQG